MCDEKSWLKLIEQISNLEDIEITVYCAKKQSVKTKKQKSNKYK